MSNKYLLDELEKNPKNVVIGGIVFNGPKTDEGFKPGLPYKKLMDLMKKASKEKLFIPKDDICFSR